MRVYQFRHLGILRLPSVGNGQRPAAQADYTIFYLIRIGILPKLGYNLPWFGNFNNKRPHSSMDRVMVFGTSDEGSTPPGGTAKDNEFPSPATN